MDSFYDRTAEYVAVLIPAAWEPLGPALHGALAGLDVSAGPVVDVGAGSGVGTAVLVLALPDAEIVAVEPHPALRAALLARVMADAELRRRVTVLDADLLSAELPRPVAGVLLMNVIGHFTPAQRSRVWALLADRLAPRGRAGGTEPVPTDPARDGAGDPDGRCSGGPAPLPRVGGAEPAGPDAVTWRMTYRVKQGAAQLTALVTVGVRARRPSGHDSPAWPNR